MRYTISERIIDNKESTVFKDLYVTYNKGWAHFLLWALSLMKKNLVIVRY